MEIDINYCDDEMIEFSNLNKTSKGYYLTVDMGYFIKDPEYIEWNGVWDRYCDMEYPKDFHKQIIEFIEDYGLPRKDDCFEWGDSYYSVYAIYIEFETYNHDTQKYEESKHIRICFTYIG